jgi:hypothetical protein
LAINAFEVDHVEIAVTSRVVVSEKRAVAVNWNVDPAVDGPVIVMAVTVGDAVGVGDAGFAGLFPVHAASVSVVAHIEARQLSRFISVSVALQPGRRATYRSGNSKRNATAKS